MKLEMNPIDRKYKISIDRNKNAGCLIIEKYDFCKNVFKEYKKTNIDPSMWNNTHQIYEIPVVLADGLYNFTAYDMSGRAVDNMRRHHGEKLKIHCSMKRLPVIMGASKEEKCVISISSNVPISRKNLYYTVNGVNLKYSVPSDIAENEIMFCMQYYPESFKLHVVDELINSIEVD